MSTGLLTPRKTDQGWVIDMTPDMARAAGVAEGSYLIFYISQGEVTTEILPPATAEVKESVRLFNERYGDFMAEMKRLGD